MWKKIFGYMNTLLNKMEIKSLKIKTSKGERIIGPGHPVFIVAEMSCNHLQDYEKALKIIDAAAEAGADAIKIQTYTADTITIESNKEPFQIKVNDIWKGQTLHELYQKAYTPWDWQPKLKEYAESKGLVFFSFPLDDTAVDFLEELKVELYKIGSFEVVDIPLLKKVGKTKKPVIISRGMSTKKELELAIKTLKKNGTPELAIFHCVSAYPADPAKMNLKMIQKLMKEFNVPVGLSDHSLSNDPAIASVALGASLIEKHLILDRSDGGFDAPFSIEPEEFRQLVKSIRAIENSLSISSSEITSQEKENLIFRKSLFIVKDVQKGEEINSQNMRSIRPGNGLPPKFYKEVMGKRAKINVERGTPLSWDLIEN